MYLVNDDGTISEVETTTFRAINWAEADVEELLRKNIELICEDEESLLIVGQQVRNQARGQSDLTAIDNNGNLVLIEVKRDRNDICHRREALEFQAIRYAASYATIRTKDDLVDKIYAKYVDKNRIEFIYNADVLSHEIAQRELNKFFAQNEIRDFNRMQRIVLVASEFDDHTLSAVAWLNRQGVNISCLRLIPYRDGTANRILLDIKKLLPVAETEDFLIDIIPYGQLNRTNRINQNSPRRSLPKIKKMLEWGIVNAGDEVYAKNVSEQKAILQTDGNVKPCGTDNKISLQKWLKEIYGWGSVATYDFTVTSSSGKTLAELREEFLNNQETASE